jgi:predicted RNA binding protein YcfA (HicA-like mRNA interferase family)
MARMPQVSARELVRFLKAQGFVEERQSGSHLTLRHAAHRTSVTIPVHTGAPSPSTWAPHPRPHGRPIPVHMGADVGRGLAVRILKDAGFSVEDSLSGHPCESKDRNAADMTPSYA